VIKQESKGGKVNIALISTMVNLRKKLHLRCRRLLRHSAPASLFAAREHTYGAQCLANPCSEISISCYLRLSPVSHHSSPNTAPSTPESIKPLRSTGLRGRHDRSSLIQFTTTPLQRLALRGRHDRSSLIQSSTTPLQRLALRGRHDRSSLIQSSTTPFQRLALRGRHDRSSLFQTNNCLLPASRHKSPFNA
jgi:hypothetical protein